MMLKNIRYHLNHKRADADNPERFYVVADDGKGNRVKSPFALTLTEAEVKLETELGEVATK